jgi:hypothetical protein
MRFAIVAVHESVVGTERTWSDVRVASAFGGKADAGPRGPQVSFLPQANILMAAECADTGVVVLEENVPPIPPCQMVSYGL